MSHFSLWDRFSLFSVFSSRPYSSLPSSQQQTLHKSTKIKNSPNLIKMTPGMDTTFLYFRKTTNTHYTEAKDEARRHIEWLRIEHTEQRARVAACPSDNARYTAEITDLRRIRDGINSIWRKLHASRNWARVRSAQSI